MPTRKLLLVTYHFPPSAAVAVYRMLGFVRHLPRFGWETIVVAPPAMPQEPQDAELLRKVPASTTVYSVPLPRGLLARLAYRFWPNAPWLLPAWRACRLAVRQHQPDAVLTSGPPHCIHRLGLHLHRRYRLPWLACFRDPWVVNQHQLASPPRWERRMERKVMHNADAVIANTPLGMAGLQNAYPEAASRLCCITNGFDPERFPPAPPPVPRERLLMLHAGELYFGRDPRPLLDVLRDLETTDYRPRFALHFLGRSTGKDFDLGEEVRQRHLENVVTLADQVPYRQALTHMVAADLLLLIHSPAYRIGVPAKLYEYLGAGKPILALAEEDSDIAWVLRASGVLHRLAPPGDRGRIKQALCELGHLAAQHAAVSTDASSLRTFTREYLAEQLAQRLDACIGESL